MQEYGFAERKRGGSGRRQAAGNDEAVNERCIRWKVQNVTLE